MMQTAAIMALFLAVLTAAGSAGAEEPKYLQLAEKGIGGTGRSDEAPPATEDPSGKQGTPAAPAGVPLGAGTPGSPAVPPTIPGPAFPAFRPSSPDLPGTSTPVAPPAAPPVAPPVTPPTPSITLPPGP